jgi:membrane protein implicated in regulation of membrane protease activity
MGIFAGVMVPVGVMVIRPRFSPKGVAYGTTGTGVEKGNRYTTLLREYDQATGIKVNGDFFRLRVLESGQTELPEGTQVVFKRFEGTTALVTLTPSDTDDRSRATPNTQES